MFGLSSVTTWLVIGFLGQAIFTARFVVQWVASERRRDSVVPIAFWWLSLLGGLTLLAYAVHRQDPVIILGQSLGVFIYVRNLMLLTRRAAARSNANQPEPSRRAGPALHGPHRPVEPSPGPSTEAGRWTDRSAAV